ncbi:MAG: YesL family protein [Lachnospiraceae bacterium]|nr:YesL family protein [Lachnospiraceae bacterium]
MLSGIFNYDNPVWRFIGKFCDVLILNVLWLICSIPIVTVGASTTAVYYVTLKLVRDEEGPTIRSFFKSFKENFKQATVLWLIMLVVGCLLGFDLYFFLGLQTTPSMFRTIMVAIFGGFSLIYLFVLLFVFPLQARFYNPVKRTLFNAFFISVRHVLHSLGILVMDIGLVLVALFLLPMLQALLFLFGFPLLAFLNSYIIVGVFDKYMPQQEDDEARPLDI